MWAQGWNNIVDISAPYPENEAVDVTPQMTKQVMKQVHYACMMPDTVWSGKSLLDSL
jgi:hypothetical protein